LLLAARLALASPPFSKTNLVASLQNRWSFFIKNSLSGPVARGSARSGLAAFSKTNLVASLQNRWSFFIKNSLSCPAIFLAC